MNSSDKLWELEKLKHKRDDLEREFKPIEQEHDYQKIVATALVHEGTFEGTVYEEEYLESERSFEAIKSERDRINAQISELLEDEG